MDGTLNFLHKYCICQKKSVLVLLELPVFTKLFEVPNSFS